MTRAAALALLVLALTGCQVTEYYAEGVSVATRDRDLGLCRAEARQTYPPLMQTRFTPRVFRPGGIRCDAAGQCVTLLPTWEGGDPYSVDVNEDARAEAIAACMAGHGYAQIRLPVCDRGAGIAPSTVMAPLTAETCLIRTGGGALIVNP